MEQIDGQLSLMDMLAKEAPEVRVPIHGALDVHSMPISEFEVSLCYGDLVLLVSMVEDYVKGLDEIKKGDILWENYYRTRYKDMSERIQKQISYDFEKAKAKCLKENKSKSDIGGDALALAIKYSPKPKQKEDKESEEQS